MTFDLAEEIKKVTERWLRENLPLYTHETEAERISERQAYAEQEAKERPLL